MRTPLALLALLLAAPAMAADPDTGAARERMLSDIRATVREIGDRKLAISDDVLAAVGRVPRHLFVPEAQRRDAYDNRPLPIGNAQTISQPYIVALMTELVRVGRGAKVLEVGTGSGYQAAVLAELGAEVYTIEIVRELGEASAKLLKELGYGSITARIGDGYAGWPESAPFDGIVVTAAPDHIPQPLIDQLKVGARMVIPVGRNTQQLAIITKKADGSVQRDDVLLVSFVPLTGRR